MDNFMEVDTVEQANSVDLRIWKFVDHENGKYVFARRTKPLVVVGG
jgi:hypothetical protein